MNQIIPKTALYVILSFLPLLPAANCAQHTMPGMPDESENPNKALREPGPPITLTVSVVEAKVSDIFDNTAQLLMPDPDIISIENLTKALLNKKAFITGSLCTAANTSREINAESNFRLNQDVIRKVTGKDNSYNITDYNWVHSSTKIDARIIGYDHNNRSIVLYYKVDYNAPGTFLDQADMDPDDLFEDKIFWSGRIKLKSGQCKVAAYTIKEDAIIFLTIFTQMEK
jgi:hypothetical protein